MRYLKKLSVLLLLALSSFSVVADINHHFEQIKHDANALYLFLKTMPKGGDLHYHLTGGAYAEAMLSLASGLDYCFIESNWTIEKNINQCQGIPSNYLTPDSIFYDSVISAWSMKGFDFNGNETAHDHFFATFSKFSALTRDHYPELLVDVMERAASQNEQYLEIMVLPNAPSLTAVSQTQQPLTADRFEQRLHQLVVDPAFQTAVTQTIESIEQDMDATRKLLACDRMPQSAVCQLTVKFQYYALRGQSLESVFERALLGFLAVQQSADFVGVNLVQQEDGVVALLDYKQHMQVFEFLHQHYPEVPISLHAGELNRDIAKPKDLRFHIHDAIYVGQAKRIGHGTDIEHEEHAEKTLNTMRKGGIAVEINLTSNATILNAEGKTHPLKQYLSHHVPVVLSTDDEGILRTNLTAEYVKAVIQHDLDYPIIKEINRNSLSYSFLPGKSLWADPQRAVRIAECRDLNSISCVQFIQNNEKAKLQRQLEIALDQFESEF